MSLVQQIKQLSVATGITTAIVMGSIGSAQSGETEHALVSERPAENQHLFFTDRYATGYYAIDAAANVVVVTIVPGREGQGQPMQFSTHLADGEESSIQVGGHGPNTILVTLTFARSGASVTPTIVTDVTS